MSTNHTSTANPFEKGKDPDRHFIWQRLMIADTQAFVAGDFSRIEDDFDAEQFEGIRCFLSVNPADWKVVFPDLAGYRASWIQASREWQRNPAGVSSTEEWVEKAQAELMSRVVLNRIDIVGDRALAYKRFIAAQRQTIYRLHRRGPSWKIVGFLGFLPLTSEP